MCKVYQLATGNVNAGRMNVTKMGRRKNVRGLEGGSSIYDSTKQKQAGTREWFIYLCFY